MKMGDCSRNIKPVVFYNESRRSICVPLARLSVLPLAPLPALPVAFLASLPAETFPSMLVVSDPEF
jgi:hypothetical protein